MHSSIGIQCYGADMGQGLEAGAFSVSNKGATFYSSESSSANYPKAQGLAQTSYSDKIMLMHMFGVNKCKKDTYMPSVTKSSSEIIFICFALNLQ